MRRVLAFLGVFVLLAGVLCLPVRAESAATALDLFCSVDAQGDCTVTLNATLRLEAAYERMTFPLPLNATNISVNGTGASTTRANGATLVDISRFTRDYVGTASIRFEYTIPDAVQVNPDLRDEDGNRQLQLTLPLLSGFEYPVERLGFVINLPGEGLTADPSFTSTYRQSSIESDLDITIDRSQIVGNSTATLNDRESVTMTLVVPRDMFPTVSTYVREGNPEVTPMLIFAGLALAYWLLFLRALPMRRQHTTTAPAGVTAGELGCRLTTSGADLTMMVFTWAQLGYVLIQLDGNGRVLLHKRMDMGNERGPFENKVFKSLFGSRRTVDATGGAYASLCRKVARQVPGQRQLYRRGSGSARIFRGLACGAQVFCGICVAMNMNSVPALQVVLAVILAPFGAVTGWLIQDVAYRTHLRGKVPVYIGFACIALWLALGVLCGQVLIPALCCLGQFLFGYLAAYGGRRSELGRHDGALVLGLRHYVKHLPRPDVDRLLKNDPDFFFNLAPYALALGVIKPFSRAFGRRSMDQCPYLVTRVHGRRTAQEWAVLMAAAADRMDEKQRRMQVERLLRVPTRLPAPRPAPAPQKRRRR